MVTHTIDNCMTKIFYTIYCQDRRERERGELLINMTNNNRYISYYVGAVDKSSELAHESTWLSSVGLRLKLGLSADKSAWLDWLMSQARARAYLTWLSSLISIKGLAQAGLGSRLLYPHKCGQGSHHAKALPRFIPAGPLPSAETFGRSLLARPLPYLFSRATTEPSLG